MISAMLVRLTINLGRRSNLTEREFLRVANDDVTMSVIIYNIVPHNTQLSNTTCEMKMDGHVKCE